MSSPVATAPTLAACSLHVGYGQMEVLRGVDIAVNAGQFVTLLGPNGAGKTTLMLSLAGFLRPYSGQVVLRGQVCSSAPHVRARGGLAFLGDDRHLFPSLTVRQSLRLVPGALECADQRFPKLLTLLSRRSELLSGGEQQMLALARALAGQPHVLVIDELSLGLAPMIREELLDVLRVLADSGTGVLVVEQSARAVLARADLAYVLRRGEIIDHRPAAEWAGREDELAELYVT